MGERSVISESRAEMFEFHFILFPPAGSNYSMSPTITKKTAPKAINPDMPRIPMRIS
ncbi:MAG: hypothetical protein ACFFBP_21425 [Promethearchaeota archaeon]